MANDNTVALTEVIKRYNSELFKVIPFTSQAFYKTFYKYVCSIMKEEYHTADIPVHEITDTVINRFEYYLLQKYSTRTANRNKRLMKKSFKASAITGKLPEISRSGTTRHDRGTWAKMSWCSSSVPNYPPFVCGKPGHIRFLLVYGIEAWRSARNHGRPCFHLHGLTPVPWVRVSDDDPHVTDPPVGYSPTDHHKIHGAVRNLAAIDEQCEG